MFDILNKNYKEKMGIDIQMADLGHSTDKFNFFVTQSISQSITLSQGSSKSGTGSGTLMNKLISLSSEGKFSIIDSVVDKVSKKTEEKKIQSVEKSSSYEVISTAQKESTTKQFDIIEEVDEEMNEEEEIEKELA